MLAGSELAARLDQLPPPLNSKKALSDGGFVGEMSGK